MQYTVHQQITVNQLKVNDISNSSILQIGSSGSMAGYSVVGADTGVSDGQEQENGTGAAAPWKPGYPPGKKGGNSTYAPGMPAAMGGYPAGIQSGWPNTEVDDPPFVSNELDPIFVPFPLPIWEGW